MPRSKLTTEADVFMAYQAAQRLDDSEFARQIGSYRQQYWQWKNRVHYVQRDWLIKTARTFAGSWQSDMAVDILRRRGEDEAIPCVCLEQVGDNGPCPRHPTPEEEKVKA